MYRHLRLCYSACMLIAYNSDGQVYTVLANELVPGDLVRFSTGDRIPADCRLVSVSDRRLPRFRINDLIPTCVTHSLFRLWTWRLMNRI